MQNKYKITKKSQGAILFAILFVFSVRFASASEISPQNTIRLVNVSRSEMGLPLLVEDPTLTKVANDKAQDMLDRKYFAHTSPEGVSPWYWFEKEGYDYKYAGENLAVDFVTAEAQHAAWMKSEKHKQNILNNKYSEIGVAVAAGEIDGHAAIFTVEVFGTPAKSGAGQKGGENFSAENRSADPSHEKGKGVVLSAKNLKDFKSQVYHGGKGYAADFKKAVQKNQNQIIDISFLASLALAALALIANPIVFVSKSWGSIYADLRNARKRKMSEKDGLAYPGIRIV